MRPSSAQLVPSIPAYADTCAVLYVCGMVCPAVRKELTELRSITQIPHQNLIVTLICMKLAVSEQSRAIQPKSNVPSLLHSFEEFLEV